MKVTSATFRERLKRLRLSAERLRAKRAQGPREIAKLGQGLEFAGHRAYAPGDDVRYLDWNALGRLEQLVLKTFDAPNQITLVLAIDASSTQSFGSPSKLEIAKEVAAAIGFIGLYAGDRVVIAGLGGKRREYRSSTQEMDFLKTIEAIKIDDKAPFVDNCLDSLRGLRGDLLFVGLTDFQAAEESQRLFQEVVHRKAKAIALHPFAIEELWPDLNGNLKLTLVSPHAEEKKVNATVTPALLDRYQEEITNFRAATSHFCRRIGVPRYEMASSAEMERVVMDLVTAGLVRVATR